MTAVSSTLNHYVAVPSREPTPDSNRSAATEARGVGIDDLSRMHGVVSESMHRTTLDRVSPGQAHAKVDYLTTRHGGSTS